MSDTIIRVENLGKKYLIGQEGNYRYVALRDVITQGAKSLLKTLKNPQSRASRNTEEFWALKDVSFEVKQGEVVGIVGRNGAGKSTLLKILSRITEPTTGKIEINGRVASLLEVGTGFHPELTGRENIYLNGAILGMSREEIKRKFDEIVAFAEVEKFLDTPVKRYSSGMYVRLAFAVAAHLEPEILVVDEVLAVGDAAFQKKCLGKMGDVATQEGRTVLFVSHNMGAVNQLCQSAIWIETGQVKAIGEAKSITENYLISSYQGKSSQHFKIDNQKKGQVKSVRLINNQLEETSDFYCGNLVTVEITFVINQKVAGFHVACIVNNSQGYHLFSTADTDMNQELLNERQPGTYIVQVDLPTQVLNVGTYYIAIGLGIPGVEVFDRQDAVSFSLHDLGDFGTMKEGSRRAGLLLIQTDWKYREC
jgi:lipopolysaccharide transport system ATP-binding protein